MYKLTRRWPPVGWVLSFSSRPTTWVRVGEGNFSLPPSHAQLHGPARAILVAGKSSNLFGTIWHFYEVKVTKNLSR